MGVEGREQFAKPVLAQHRVFGRQEAILDAKPFLAKKGHSAADIERMQACAKSVLLTLALWSRPYVGEDLW